MDWTRRLFPLGLVIVLIAGPAAAQTPGNRGAQDVAAEAEEAPDQFEDVIVVTASRAEQRIHEVPAAITVLSSEDIEAIPADNYGDFLRNVPGLNVSQLSARDIQITGRAATFSLATQELVLMDNRTLYLDFFGFVMWDFLPLDPKEIKQIEVVRGPGSAVWGANAMSGVINLITKPPKEMQGTSLTLGGGDFDTLYGSITHAGVSGRLGYKLSGAYYQQDEPFDRPTGTIPGTEGPTNPGGTPYPPYDNQGTEQPKFNLRFDYDKSDETTWSFAGGYAGTDGIMHSGLGPFDIDTGSQMSYVKADWSHRASRASFFLNLLDGDATNLLTVGVDGQPVAFDFKSDTYNLDFSDTRVLGSSNIFTYGATVRRNEFDLSIAPRGDRREEYGVFLQDEILFGEKVRWLIGARWDNIDPIDDVFSPRTTLMFSPQPNHTFRASFNRAFRAPSMINNFLQIVIVNLAPLPTGDFPFPSLAVGNPLLQEEQLDAYEVGYVGTFGKTSFTLSAYRNETTDSVDFFPATFYTSSNPPPGFPLPPILLDIPPPLGLAGLLPSSFTYRNIGEVTDQGVELSLNWRPSLEWSAFLNYSWQDEPEVTGIEPVRLPSGEIVDGVNIPPEHRFNVGAAYSGKRFYVNAVANYVDEAFWTDVLNEVFWGPTDSYTSVGASLGVHLAGDRVTLSVSGTNVFDEDVQQHVFGDIIGRKITGQMLFRF